MIEQRLSEILKKHTKWLNGEPDGEQANFQGKNLQGINFQGANLQQANFRGADLWGANFQKANLCETNFQKASLCKTNFQRAELWEANLRGANLYGANLWKADLWEADLREADLWGADLWGASFQGANLYRAKLWEAHNIPDYIYPICCPEKGSFIGFKKALAVEKNIQVIVELEIPDDAKRSSATSRKCRCDKAKVLSITDLNGVAEFQMAVSFWDDNFIYEVGKTVIVDDYDDNRWKECSTGIHFFITRDEAVIY